MYFDNFALETLYKKAEKNKALICGGGIEQKFQKINQTFSRKILFKHEGFMSYQDYQYDFHYQRYIYNKNFIKINKLYFPNLRRYQDPPFFIKIMFKAKKFFTIKNITNIYRLKTKLKFNIRQVKDMFIGLKVCLEFAEKNNLYTLYIRSLKRLNDNMFLKNAKEFFEDESLKSIINKIIKSINIEIIKRSNQKFIINKFYKTYSLHFTLNNKKNIYFKNNSTIIRNF